MFNPEMMKMAQDMMSKMTPEQLAAMQRQAANMSPEMVQQAMRMAGSMTPDDMRRAQQAASSVNPDDVTSQASNFEASMSAQQQFQYNASLQLKGEGNALHGQHRYREAAEKYQHAISNLAGHSAQQSKELRTSCQGNLASCFLQLGQYEQCVEQCNAVLETDSNNRKALYRRGQAYSKLGSSSVAVKDLQRALQMSPETEKETIREKLREAEQQEKHASRGVIIEEVTELEAMQDEDNTPDVVSIDKPAEVDGQIEDVPAPVAEPSAVATASTSGSGTDAGMRAGAGICGSVPTECVAGMPGGFDPQQVQRLAQVMKSNPTMLQTMADQMRNMSSEQIEQALRQGGGAAAGVTPDMARLAAESLQHMSPEQLQAMADQALAAGISDDSGLAAPFPFTPEMAAAASSSDPAQQMQAATAAIKKNPEMMKNMAKMMEAMPPDQLEAMAANIPGAPAGMKIDAEQMKMAAKMMESLSPEDLERMADMARTMGVPGATAGAAGAAPGGTMPALTAAPAMNSSAGPAATPAFDPSTMPAGMMGEMRRKMEDPAMMKMVQNMMKSMDPEQLAELMKQSGVNVTPEQAKKMADSLGNMSETHMEILSRIMRYVNCAIAAYQHAKALLLSQWLLLLASVVLIIAIVLRWYGWI